MTSYYVAATRASQEGPARGRDHGGGDQRDLGARPLRRAIQQLIEDPLSEKLLWKEFRVGETVIVDVEDGEMVFRAVDAIEPPPVELAGAGADT